MSENNNVEADEGHGTITTTIEIDKDIFLKFKALCVLKEMKISGEIERLVRKRVEELSASTDIIDRETE